MARAGLEPAALINAATVLVQLTGSLLVIVGRRVWLGAGALCLFTSLKILLVHRFWIINQEPFRTIAFHTAVEHVGIIGGLLAVTILASRTEPGPVRLITVRRSLRCGGRQSAFGKSAIRPV